MTTQTQTKCPHLKFLPLDEPPGVKGVRATPCLHPTPLYYLGWIIDFDRISEAYPDFGGGSFSNYWHARVVYPWNEKYGGVFEPRKSGLPMRPDYTFMISNRKECLVVFITDNYKAEDLGRWQDKDYIRAAEEFAFTSEEEMGKLQWIRRG